MESFHNYRGCRIVVSSREEFRPGFCVGAAAATRMGTICRCRPGGRDDRSRLSQRRRVSLFVWKLNSGKVCRLFPITKRSTHRSTSDRDRFPLDSTYSARKDSKYWAPALVRTASLESRVASCPPADAAGESSAEIGKKNIHPNTRLRLFPLPPVILASNESNR